MTPRDAVLARLEALASRPRVGVYSDQLYRSEAALRLDLLRPKSDPDTADRIEGFLRRQPMRGSAVGWIPVEAIVTDGSREGWGSHSNRPSVAEIWAGAATATTHERRELFLERFGVVSVDKYVFGPRSVFVPRDDGHHRIGAAKLLELPFIRASVNETVSIAPRLVVPGRLPEVPLMREVWDACVKKGLAKWPSTTGVDGSVSIRVDPASAAPWVLLRPDQAASIGLAFQTHVPTSGSALPTPDDLVSWREWLRWLGVKETAVGGVPLQDPRLADMPAIVPSEEPPRPARRLPLPGDQ